MKWAWALALVGVLYLATVGVIIRRFNYLFASDTDALETKSWPFNVLDEKTLGLPWASDQESPLLEYREYHRLIKINRTEPTERVQHDSVLSHAGSEATTSTENLVEFMGNDTNLEAVENPIKIEVIAAKWELLVKVDGKQVYHETMEMKDVTRMDKGGLYLIVLHPSTASVMHASRHRSFEKSGDAEVMRIISDVQDGRILILANMHEGFMKLSRTVESYLKKQGSRVIADMAMGDRWALIWSKGGRIWAEGAAFATQEQSFVLQGSPVRLDVVVPRLSARATVCSSWPQVDAWIARRTFCERYEGYGSLCNCSSHRELHRPSPINIPGLKFKLETGIPTVIVASMRPVLLNRCLRHLLSVSGSDPRLTLVVADGTADGRLDEVKDLAHLYGVRYIGHDSGGTNVTIRIQRHYKFAFDSAFATFPSADKVIILEEDLKVSPDFYSYFGQLAPLIDKDPTLYCISAWNDLSNSRSLGDPRVMMRSETMAGLGWLLSRKIYQEVIPKWPSRDEYADWDMWMRLPSQQKGRECLVPEVSRTYHFGSSGAHLTAYFQSTYFSKYPFNTLPDVRLKDLDKLGPESYDQMLKAMIVQAKHLQGDDTNPCDPNIVPVNATIPHVLWFKMNEEVDNYTLTGIIKCLKLWDLDTRGEHKSLWRIKVQGTPLLIVGWPLSPFSVLKPKEVNILQRYDPSQAMKHDPVYLQSNRSPLPPDDAT